MKKRHKKRKSTATDILLTVILLAAFAGFAYAAISLLHIYREYQEGVDEYAGIAKLAVTEGENADAVQNSPAAESEGEEPDSFPEIGGYSLKPPIRVDFAPLQGLNSDVTGWIYMEAIPDINYPIVHGEDNDYYLHTTYQGNYNIAGSIFVDALNSRYFDDPHTIIYGHNMKNGSMFGQLKNMVEDPSIYGKSPYFWIFTPLAAYRYEIIAAYVADVYSETYRLFETGEEGFTDWIARQKASSAISIPSSALDNLTPYDKIITLSTCTGNEATRCVIQGRRVDTIY